LHRAKSIAFLLAALTAAVPTYAQEAAPDAARLKALERDLEQGKAERERLQSQAEAAERGLAKARTDMIAVAKDIQDQEYSVTLLENKIAGLERDVARMSEALKRRDEQMGRVLMALERLALRPGDALTLSPLSPDDAVRSAILLRSALPSIKGSAVALQTDLAQLYRVRAQITDQKEKAAAGAAMLLSKRMRLEKLMAERAEQQVALASRKAGGRKGQARRRGTESSRQESGREKSRGKTGRRKRPTTRDFEAASGRGPGPGQTRAGERAGS
jgi:septal ring factor EnvC (AmiA/AmiB activator)